MLRRDRERGSLVGTGRREGRAEARGDVAVVIGAHNAETEIADAVAAALRLAHRGDVHVVADDSTDKTAEIARGLGVNVVETVKPLGRSGALVAALDGFALTENYAYVLVLDVDHRPHPAYLDRTLPIFDDPDVVAVAGFARTDWTSARRTPIGRVLTAYRARGHMLTQALLTIIRTRPNGEAARWLPSPARMFRTSVLTQVDLAPDGVPIADFDVSNQVYRAGLGRIVVVRGAVVGTRDPDKLIPYVRQTRQWAVGFWQAVRRNGLFTGPQRLGLGWFAVESTITAAVFVALPFLLGFGVLSIWTVLLGVFVPDLAMTALVALRQRQPRFVLPALFLPFMRLLDSVIFLSALPDAFVDRKASARWLSPVRAGKLSPPPRRAWRGGGHPCSRCPGWRLSGRGCCWCCASRRPPSGCPRRPPNPRWSTPCSAGSRASRPPSATVCCRPCRNWPPTPRRQARSTGTPRCLRASGNSRSAARRWSRWPGWSPRPCCGCTRPPLRSRWPSPRSARPWSARWRCPGPVRWPPRGSR
ncbi:glycosyltransferase [Actinokineospora sp. G85]|uniref:glycosyltransferase n=1 Tax=Actinokineospora sp. G85 TaxID=3406626 RepID=UPI003C721FBB